jgi:hypothetical protein
VCILSVLLTTLYSGLFNPQAIVQDPDANNYLAAPCIFFLYAYNLYISMIQVTNLRFLARMPSWRWSACGNVTLEGGLVSATGGRIELGSVGANSLVSLSPVSNGWALGYDNVQKVQDIQLSQGSLISAGEPREAVIIAARQLRLLQDQ